MKNPPIRRNLSRAGCLIFPNRLLEHPMERFHSISSSNQPTQPIAPLSSNRRPSSSRPVDRGPRASATTRIPIEEKVDAAAFQAIDTLSKTLNDGWEQYHASKTSRNYWKDAFVPLYEKLRGFCIDMDRRGEMDAKELALFLMLQSQFNPDQYLERKKETILHSEKIRQAADLLLKNIHFKSDEIFQIFDLSQTLLAQIEQSKSLENWSEGFQRTDI